MESHYHSAGLQTAIATAVKTLEIGERAQLRLRSSSTNFYRSVVVATTLFRHPEVVDPQMKIEVLDPRTEGKRVPLAEYVKEPAAEAHLIQFGQERLSQGELVELVTKDGIVKTAETDRLRAERYQVVTSTAKYPLTANAEFLTSHTAQGRFLRYSKEHALATIIYELDQKATQGASELDPLRELRSLVVEYDKSSLGKRYPEAVQFFSFPTHNELDLSKVMETVKAQRRLVLEKAGKKGR